MANAYGTLLNGGAHVAPALPARGPRRRRTGAQLSRRSSRSRSAGRCPRRSPTRSSRRCPGSPNPAAPPAPPARTSRSAARPARPTTAPTPGSSAARARAATSASPSGWATTTSAAPAARPSPAAAWRTSTASTQVYGGTLPAKIYDRTWELLARGRGRGGPPEADRRSRAASGGSRVRTRRRSPRRVPHARGAAPRDRGVRGSRRLCERCRQQPASRRTPVALAQQPALDAGRRGCLLLCNTRRRPLPTVDAATEVAAVTRPSRQPAPTSSAPPPSARRTRPRSCPAATSTDLGARSTRRSTPPRPGCAASAWSPATGSAISLGNTLDFPVAYFGVLRAGLVAVPLNTGYTRARAALRRCRRQRRPRASSSTRRRGRDALAAARRRARRRSSTSSSPSRARRRGDLLDDAARAGRGPVDADAGGGEDLAVAALHLRHERPARRARCCRHRALLANLDQGAQHRPAGHRRRRRRAAGPAAVPRLRPQRRARRGRPRTARPACWSSASTRSRRSAEIRRRRRDQRGRRAADVRRLVDAARRRRRLHLACGWRCPARRRCRRRCCTGSST